MLKVAINGKFLSDRMQGIVRYARELVGALDEVLDNDDHVELVVPKSVPTARVPVLKRIRIVRWGNHAGIAWEQLDFAYYLLKHRDLMALNLCNVAPFIAPAGVTTLHDIMYKTCPEFYTSPRNKVSRAWHCLQYALIVRRERAILTVSNYSKHEIERVYEHARGKVAVVPNAWQHVLSYGEAHDWHTRYPDLVPHEYLFTMATLARNKNGRWVFEVAKRNPQLTFAMAGKRYEADDVQVPPNVELLGFVSDEDACALIKNCRAFLYPSLYEGFGLPPLEALALGAQVISSDATSLPEVLGDAVHYIDPLYYDVDLNEILEQPVGSKEEALSKYSWQHSGEQLVQALDERD